MSVLKSFCSRKNIPLIPPLLYINTSVTDFKQKGDIFNNFFASQCITFVNNSVIPGTQSYKTNSRLSSLSFENDELIRSLNIQKAHGPDDISIRIIKIGDSGLVKTLSLMYQNCLDCSTFPDIWKKSSICPVHKANDKQIINNYRPVSLLPVFVKILEILFLSLFLSISMNTNRSQNINPVSDQMIHAQISYCLLFLTYIRLSMLVLLLKFEVFLDMSKAFDKV